MIPLGFLLASIGLSATAQILLKLGVHGRRLDMTDGLPDWRAIAAVLSEPLLLGALGLYGLSVLLWVYVLSRVELSLAYPFVGLGFVITSMAGVLLFGETLSSLRLLGTGLVLAGIVLLSRSA